ncbi:hypothetical protein QBC45DRAFT_455679 [Copromyces sp. CBS 386.78]|nr:hypothetical protein QBC45DRAFT_455679 [Copromyces sp. CBS 386.78]
MSFNPGGDNFISSIITPSLVTPTTAADTPISIFSYTPYLQQRECVKDCIWHSGSTATDLIIALGCSGPWVNECYCSGDDNYEHASTASSFLRSCVADSCRISSTDALVTSGFGVYNEYCAEVGMAVPLAVASTTGSGDEVTGVVTESKSGENGAPTGTYKDWPGSASLGTGTGLSTGAKVRIAVGSIVAALALAVSAVITWRLKVKARISLSRRKDITKVEEHDAGRTDLPQLQIIRHSGLPAVTTRYN